MVMTKIEAKKKDDDDFNIMKYCLQIHASSSSSSSSLQTFHTMQILFSTTNEIEKKDCYLKKHTHKQMLFDTGQPIGSLFKIKKKLFFVLYLSLLFIIIIIIILFFLCNRKTGEVEKGLAPRISKISLSCLYRRKNKRHNNR